MVAILRSRGNDVDDDDNNDNDNDDGDDDDDGCIPASAGVLIVNPSPFTL